MTQTKTMKKTKRNVVLRNETTSSEGRGLELAMEFLDVLEGTTVWGKIRCLRKEYKDRREMMKKNNFKNETDDFRNTPFYYIDALSKLIRSLESETDKVYESGDNVLVKSGDTWKKGVVSSYGMFSIKVATKKEELELHTLDILPYAKDIEEQIQLLTDWAEKGFIDASELEEIIESIKKSREACDEEENEESDVSEEVNEEQALPDEPVIDDNTNKMALKQIVESPEEEEKEEEAEQQEEEKPEEEKDKEKEEEEIQKQSVEEIKTIEVTQTIVKRRGRPKKQETIVDEQLSLFAM
ncbi:hypothetical protein [Bacillus cereus group sp. TH152-1LC]|uniref:hypothetical protein n=1 Tax=Bacillus cereus group sp. TH152-1LC TaxID=3018060 RepID=UPI0022E8A7C5|nr:hypothetical protein [Bacillus cereus group sp. TH152-1LC]MDA1675305.1 hypothetical protein [Bacillus cereus group sp. TH152-1LC]